MWFTIVFFGEHYVSDALIGIALAALVFVGVRRYIPRTWFAGPFPAPMASARGAPRRSPELAEAVEPLRPARRGRSRCRARSSIEHARCSSGRITAAYTFGA